MKQLNRKWWFTLFHNIRIRRKQMKTYFDHIFHIELWNWLPKDLVDGNGFRKQTHLDTDIQLYSVLALLSPCHLLLSPFRGKIPNFGVLIEHTTAVFVSFTALARSRVSSISCRRPVKCYFRNFSACSELLFQQCLVPSGTMQYFTSNFLQAIVLSYFTCFMILGLSQKCLVLGHIVMTIIAIFVTIFEN